MKSEGYAVLAIVLTGSILWAFRKGGQRGQAKAQARSQESEINALEALNETHDEVDGLDDNAVLERLRDRASRRD